MSVEQMLAALLRDGWWVSLYGLGALNAAAWQLVLVGDERHGRARREYKGYDLYSVVRAAHLGDPEGMIGS